MQNKKIRMTTSQASGRVGSGGLSVWSLSILEGTRVDGSVAEDINIGGLISDKDLGPFD